MSAPTIVGTRVRRIEPDERCGRCRHASRYHARAEDGGECRVSSGPRIPGAKTKTCLCDSFFPEERTEG